MPRKTDDLKEALERFPRTLSGIASNFLSAMLVWLFGTLVFIPLAHSIDVSGRTAMVCSLVILGAFATFIFRAVLQLGPSIEVLSSVLALKYGTGLSQEDAKILFTHALYVAASVLLCALSMPLLVAIHPALFGLTVILVLTWMFFLLVRILPLLFTKISMQERDK